MHASAPTKNSIKVIYTQTNKSLSQHPLVNQTVMRSQHTVFRIGCVRKASASLPTNIHDHQRQIQFFKLASVESLNVPIMGVAGMLALFAGFASIVRASRKVK